MYELASLDHPTEKVTETYRNRASTALDSALSRVMSLRKARGQSIRHSPNPDTDGK
jgi:hypothetical protein